VNKLNYKKYNYSNNALTKEPYKSRKVIFKNKISQLFCNHRYEYLVMNKKDSMYFNISGDEIANICPKCGRVAFTTFWEHEGMGYK